MKPVEPGAFTKRTRGNFNSQQSLKAEDLFLPSVIAIVEHLARVAAETDYAHFLATSTVPPNPSEREARDD